MKQVLAISLVLTLAAAANAAINVTATVDGISTPSNPAYMTDTVTLQSGDPTAYVTGWGGSFQGPDIEQMCYSQLLSIAEPLQSTKFCTFYSPYFLPPFTCIL